jgi:hypothetical protein
MEFDPFGLSVKDLATRLVLARYYSTGPLYTLHLPTSTTPTLCVVSYAMATAASSATWHRRLGHPTPTSSQSCRVAQLSRALGAEMIPYVIPASLVGSSGCPLLAPLLKPFSPLTSYTVTFGLPLFRVSLVTSIT